MPAADGSGAEAIVGNDVVVSGADMIMSRIKLTRKGFSTRQKLNMQFFQVQSEYIEANVIKYTNEGSTLFEKPTDVRLFKILLVARSLNQTILKFMLMKHQVIAPGTEKMYLAVKNRDIGNGLLKFLSTLGSMNLFKIEYCTCHILCYMPRESSNKYKLIYSY
uniref:Uncharacterized protein n=1 Tax=Romanomermis culicivorax TaxID=13658 RepID=A0A915KSV4_ROMCU